MHCAYRCFSRSRLEMKFRSAILTDFVMRGIAISFATLFSVALWRRIFVLF